MIGKDSYEIADSATNFLEYLRFKYGLGKLDTALSVLFIVSAHLEKNDPELFKTYMYDKTKLEDIHKQDG